MNETRDSRMAQRIAWLNTLPPIPSTWSDRLEPGQLLKEATGCFIHGYFMAVVLLGTSLVEQELQEALELRGLVKPGNKLNLETVIEKVRDAEFPDTELLDMADNLRKVRNPLTHRKEDGHQYTLTWRFLASKDHPDTILEEDAKLAMMVMRRVHLAMTIPASEDDLEN